MLPATERLYLRPWRSDDCDAVVTMYAKPQVMRWIPGGVWDRDKTLRFVTRMIEAHERRDVCIYPVVLKENAAIIGHCGLNHLEGGAEIEIAYLVDDRFWHRGFATEIAGAVLQEAFHATDVDRIVAVAFPENLRSVVVMERIGMHPIGVARHFGADVVKYEITRSRRGAVK